MGTAALEGPAMKNMVFKRWALTLSMLSVVAATLAAAPLFAAEPPHELLLVVGAPAERSIEVKWLAATEAWREASTRAGAHLTVIGTGASQPQAETAPTDDRERIREFLTKQDLNKPSPLWLVYLGHGTFDRKNAWWNLHGPDVSAEELAGWLKPLERRPVVLVHGGSASGPFVPALSGPQRIVITATRSGDEVNYARFGEKFAAAVASPDADLDQDGTTSLLEAFLFAAKQTQSFYADATRMLTEHALIDDNGDKLGTPADWFKGTRVVKRPDNSSAAADGLRAHQIALIESPETRALSPEQRAQRDTLEQQLEKIRARRSQLPEADYLREIEMVLRQLAAIYRGESPTAPNKAEDS
jgi:hypothetical protein